MSGLIFAQLRKIDELQRQVWGFATSEVADSAGEVMDYESSKPNFEAWSNQIKKATGGKSLGNVRGMHQEVAAGKIIHLELRDATKDVWIGAEIVDDAEWKKCLKGVYTGFSIGGSYGKRWPKDGLIWYEARPTEISLVDNPCNKGAVITLVKADGTEETLPLGKGDSEGHPFRGNQWTDGTGGAGAASASKDTILEGLTPEPGNNPGETNYRSKRGGVLWVDVKGDLVVGKANLGLRQEFEEHERGDDLAYGFKVGDDATVRFADGESQVGVMMHYKDDYFYVDTDKGWTRVYKTNVKKSEEPSMKKVFPPAKKTPEEQPAEAAPAAEEKAPAAEAAQAAPEKPAEDGEKSDLKPGEQPDINGEQAAPGGQAVSIIDSALEAGTIAPEVAAQLKELLAADEGAEAGETGTSLPGSESGGMPSQANEALRSTILEVLVELGLAEKVGGDKEHEIVNGTQAVVKVRAATSLAKSDGLAKIEAHFAAETETLRKDLDAASEALEARITKDIHTLALDLAKMHSATQAALSKVGGMGPVLREIGTVNGDAIATELDLLQKRLSMAVSEGDRQNLQLQIARLNIQSIQK